MPSEPLAWAIAAEWAAAGPKARVHQLPLTTLAAEAQRLLLDDDIAETDTEEEGSSVPDSSASGFGGSSGVATGTAVQKRVALAGSLLAFVAAVGKSADDGVRFTADTEALRASLHVCGLC